MKDYLGKVKIIKFLFIFVVVISSNSYSADALTSSDVVGQWATAIKESDGEIRKFIFFNEDGNFVNTSFVVMELGERYELSMVFLGSYKINENKISLEIGKVLISSSSIDGRKLPLSEEEIKMIKQSLRITKTISVIDIKKNSLLIKDKELENGKYELIRIK